MKKIKSKLFKFLLFSTFTLPSIFFQNACSKKNNDENFKKELDELKVKIKNLEKIRSSLSTQLEPFKVLMNKYGVNNFDDLMEKLTDLSDPDLQKQALLLANCLLETKTITFSKLQEKLNDEQWKKENIQILTTLIEPFKLKSIDDLSNHFIVNDKVKVLAEKISKIDNDFIKIKKDEIKKLKTDLEQEKLQFKQNKNELIAICLAQLWDENYNSWEEFIKQFDNVEWKEDEKNKPIIEKLASLLECNFDEVNKQEIEKLDKEAKDGAQNLLSEKQRILNKPKEELEKLKKKLISFYLGELVDETYTNWDSFVAKFSDENWKKQEKNTQIIGELCALLQCRFHEIYDKIIGLDQETKDHAKKILENKHNDVKKIKKLESDINATKNEIIELKIKLNIAKVPFVLLQLYDETYTNWDSFVAKFNDENWKKQEKNKQIIGELCTLLKCGSHEIYDKIIGLDQETKDHAKTLLENKHNDVKKIKKLKDTIKENENKIIELNVRLNVAKELLSKKQENENKIIEKYKSELIAFYLGQLGEGNYYDWKSFIEQFNDDKWKKSAKRKPIIEILTNLLDCTFDQINSERIDILLDQETKNIAQKILSEKKEAKKLKIEQKEKQFEQSKKRLIAFYLGELEDGTSYIDWDSFVAKFNDENWKKQEKNKQIIGELCTLLKCGSHEIHDKIIGLDQETKKYAKDLLWEKKNKYQKNIIEKFEQSKNELIAIYLYRLSEDSYDGWDNYVTRFKDENWKKQGKNKPIIEKLASLLGCTSEQLDCDKIKDLGLEVRNILYAIHNEMKNAFSEREKTLNEMSEVALSEREKQLVQKEEQIKHDCNKLICIHLLKLWLRLWGEEEYKTSLWPLSFNWDSWSKFCNQFNNKEWKENEKNKPIIEDLASLLNCNFEEVNPIKINHVMQQFEVENGFKEMLNERREVLIRIKQLEQEKELKKHEEDEELEKWTKELIAICLGQLGDENYTKWDKFVEQFDNIEWKKDEKNKPIIEKLASLLECNFDEVNKQEIEKLDEEVKDSAQQMLSERQKALNGLKKQFKVDFLVLLWKKNYTNWKEKVFNATRGPRYQTFDDDWESLTKRFSDANWKNNKTNKPIIEKLASLLGCTSDEINKEKINDLKYQTKDKLFEEARPYFELANKEIEEAEKEKQDFELSKEALIASCLFWLIRRNNWFTYENFMKLFNDLNWKQDKENNPIIKKIISLLNCTIEQLNDTKIINSLSSETKSRVQKACNDKKLHEMYKEQFEYNKRFVPFYFGLLWNENYRDWESFIEQFNDFKWKEDEKNKPIIENLSILVNHNFESVINKETIEKLDEETKNNAQKILNEKKKIFEQKKEWESIEKGKKIEDYVKEMESKKQIVLNKWKKQLEQKEKQFKKKKKQLEQCKNELIAAYLGELGNEKYTEWDKFAEQFDKVEWKEDEKNKPIIEKLASLLECNFDEVNKQEIEKLDKEAKDDAQNLLSEKQRILNKPKEELEKYKKELEKYKKELEKLKKKLISFYLGELWDSDYYDWNNFVNQFEDVKWKNDEKNKPIIEKLASLLKCNFDEVNKQEIEKLDKEVKDDAQKILGDKTEIWDKPKKQLNQKELELEQFLKLDRTPLYIGELGDKNYHDWKSFTGQFEDDNWINNEKNKPIIMGLSLFLKCTFDKVGWKIKNLDEETKNIAQKILSEKGEMLNRPKWKIKEEQLEQCKNELIALYLAQLGKGEDIYTYWNRFIEQFDNIAWKDKNGIIIGKLVDLSNCPIRLMDSKWIDGLDEEIKNNAKALLNEKPKYNDFIIKDVDNKEKEFEQKKKELIAAYLGELGNEKYTEWDKFAEQFDKVEWKEDVNNKKIIEKLARLLKCDFNKVNKKRIEGLDLETINITQKVLSGEWEVLNNSKKQLEQNKENLKEDLIIICIYQLWDENYNSWDDFIKQFDKVEWKEDVNNKKIIEKLAKLLECSFTDINSKKINGYNEIKSKFYSFIKVADLNNLLRANNLKNEYLKQKFNRINDVFTRIDKMYDFCYISLQIYSLLVENVVDRKMTYEEIAQKINSNQLSSYDKKVATLIYKIMLKLNVPTIDLLCNKIQNWLELLEFIINGESIKISELSNVLIDCKELIKNY